MEHFSSLQDFITALETGSRFHISVVFFNRFGGELTALDPVHIIHATPFCDLVKRRPDGLTRCMQCKHKTIEKIRRTGKPFAGYCINDVYEYCHPVFCKGELSCILYIGNILRDREEFCRRNALSPTDPVLDTLEPALEEAQCRRIAEALDSYIRLLLPLAGEPRRTDGLDLTVQTVKGYVDHYFFQDISLTQLALLYHYNEKYLGRLFKKQVGISFADYLNEQRLSYARSRLSGSEDSVLDIAADAGFNHVTYFNRLFKARYGLTPTQYRHGQPDMN